MKLIEQFIKELEGFLPKGAPEEQVNGALERDLRAQAAGLETKAIDAEAGKKALESVKAMEEGQKADRAVIQTLQASLETVKAELAKANAELAESKAFRARSEKAMTDIKHLLVMLNAKPELMASDKQAQLAAIEEGTKAKIETAEGAGKASGVLTLKRFEYGSDGRPVAKPI